MSGITKDDTIIPGPCVVCQKVTEMKCAGCKTTYYCSSEHQKDNWKIHKDVCKPYEVCCSQSGKYLKVSRDLEPGEIILSELPLVIGPRTVKITEGSFPCVGCCKTIESAEVSKPCPGCGWPCCSTDCQGLTDKARHSIECKILKMAAIRGVRTFLQYYRFDVLIALRALCLQAIDKQKWNLLLCFDDHMEERSQGTETFERINDKVTFLEEIILKPFKAYEVKTKLTFLPEVSSDLIQKIYGIIEVHSFTYPGNENIILLYPTANSLEQNCIPNTYQIIEAEDAYRISYRAALPMMKGEHVTSTYTNLLVGTSVRRRDLRRKYLTCDCSRCRDPTELESFCSALVCMGTEKAPCKGVQLPLKPLDDKTKWVCSKCKIKLPNKEILQFVAHLNKEVDKVLLNKPCIKECEDTIDKLSNFLHPNHYLVFKVKYCLAQLYNADSKSFSHPTNGVIGQKIKLCNELIEILKKLDPGNARLYTYSATLLKELGDSKFIQLKSNYQPDVKDRFIAEVNDITNLFEEAKHILQYELKTTTGSKLYNEICDCESALKLWTAENKLE